VLPLLVPAGAHVQKAVTWMTLNRIVAVILRVASFHPKRQLSETADARFSEFSPKLTTQLFYYTTCATLRGHLSDG